MERIKFWDAMILPKSCEVAFRDGDCLEAREWYDISKLSKFEALNELISRTNFFFRRGECETLDLGPVNLTGLVPSFSLTCNRMEWSLSKKKEPLFRASSPSPLWYQGEPPHPRREGGVLLHVAAEERERERERERAVGSVFFGTGSLLLPLPSERKRGVGSSSERR